MKVSLECTYCGHKWVVEVYNQDSLNNKTCIHGNCRHRRLIAKDLSTTKIDYYEGSPPFPIELDHRTLKEWL